MARNRPFRFGIQATGTYSRAEWTELAKAVEDSGASTLTIADHFDQQMAPFTALMAAADATTTLRLGTVVICNDFRHPAIVAKEAATLDLLSNGRFELGLGAGWLTSDYQQVGLRLERPSLRIERLSEALTLIKTLFQTEPVHFSGKHYQVDGLVNSPSPAQAPHPPIMVGGGGEKILRLAAREANIVALNIDLRSGAIDENAGPSATSRATTQKLDWIKESAGDRYRELELQVRVHLAEVTNDRQAIAELLAPAFGLSTDEALVTPHALVGSTEEIVEQLLRQREEWDISYIGLSADALGKLAPVITALAGT